MSKKGRWINISVYIVSILLVVLIGVRLYSYFNAKARSKNIKELLVQKDLDIVFGDDKAETSIIMYSSYTCTFCKKFFTDVYPQLKEQYIDKGTVKLVMRLITYTNNHDINQALRTAVCISKYGNYEPLHELLLNDSKVIRTQEFKDIIDEFIMKDLQVAECILEGASQEHLAHNLKEFKTYNFKGTPTFIIGNKIHTGYIDYEQLNTTLIEINKSN